MSTSKVLGTWHYTLANSNLHQPLISFLYMIPRVNNIEKMYKRDAKFEIRLTRNLITKTKYYLNLTISKKYSFIICDIRMKYCGFGCQNSCGYPRMRIRMRSSDTPLLFSVCGQISSYTCQIYLSLPHLFMAFSNWQA